MDLVLGKGTCLMCSFCMKNVNLKHGWEIKMIVSFVVLLHFYEASKLSSLRAFSRVVTHEKCLSC